MRIGFLVTSPGIGALAGPAARRSDMAVPLGAGRATSVIADQMARTRA